MIFSKQDRDVLLIYILHEKLISSTRLLVYSSTNRMNILCAKLPKTAQTANYSYWKMLFIL